MSVEISAYQISVNSSQLNLASSFTQVAIGSNLSIVLPAISNSAELEFFNTVGNEFLVSEGGKFGYYLIQQVTSPGSSSATTTLNCILVDSRGEGAPYDLAAYYLASGETFTTSAIVTPRTKVVPLDFVYPDGVETIEIEVTLDSAKRTLARTADTNVAANIALKDLACWYSLSPSPLLEEVSGPRTGLKHGDKVSIPFSESGLIRFFAAIDGVNLNVRWLGTRKNNYIYSPSGMSFAETVDLNALDTDVASFQGILTSNSNNFDLQEITMLNTAITAIKAEPGLWDTIRFLWIPIGNGDLNSALRCIKHPDGVGTSLVNTNFVSGDWDYQSGLGDTSNTSKKVGTLYNPSEDGLVADNTHVCVVSETNSNSPEQRELSGFTLILQRSSGNSFYRSFGTSSAIENGSGLSSTEGVLYFERNGTTAQVRRNDSQAISVSTAATVQATPSVNLEFFAADNIYSQKIFSLLSIGTAQTAAQHAAYEAALQALRTNRAALV